MPIKIRIDVYHHFEDSTVADSIEKILTNTNKILMTQEEVAQKLNDLTTEISKVNSEVTAKLAELQAAIDAQGNASPEVTAALEALTTAVKGVDDLIPDA